MVVNSAIIYNMVCRIAQLVVLIALCLLMVNIVNANAGADAQFKLYFNKPKNKDYRDLGVVLKESNQFQSIIDGINKEFILPENIKVIFSDDEGPVYNPSTKTITMSYGFIFYATTLYVKRYPDASDEDIISFSIATATFLFYHELAHALIDAYHLPIVSNEETAADNLAVILALEYTNDGYAIVIDSAELFDLLDSTNKTYDEDELWDVHALDSQRFYNILCLSYGKDPKAVMSDLKALNNKNLLTFVREEGDSCKEQYTKQTEAWLHLLESHFRSS